MGSFIEINDTLRISKQQGFPDVLEISKHQETPFTLADVEGQVFEFSNKEKIRIYKIPPVRNFLVEERDGKWIYWGQCFMLSVHHDYENETTSGTYKIIRINTPQEIKEAFQLIDTRPELNYFS